MVRKNNPSPASRAFATAWAHLSPAQQQRMMNELRTALLSAVSDAGAVQPVHLPVTTRHAHPHHAYYADGTTGSHNHTHEHDGDADHDHDHENIGAAVESAEQAKRSRQARAAGVVYNSARTPADPWDELYRLGRLGRGLRGRSV